MKMPQLTAEATSRFEALAADDSRLVVRKMFGCPCAFVNGNMCFGTYGSSVFVRLGENDLVAAKRIPGVRPFEPMPGRTMKSYVILPPAVLSDREESRRWVERAVKHCSRLPPKRPKSRR